MIFEMYIYLNLHIPKKVFQTVVSDNLCVKVEPFTNINLLTQTIFIIFNPTSVVYKTKYLFLSKCALSSKNPDACMPMPEIGRGAKTMSHASANDNDDDFSL